MGVTGVGGFVFRAKDPEAQRDWYVEHLGVGSAPYGSWDTQAGPSVFALFPADTDAIPAGRGWVLNLRVDAAGPAATVDERLESTPRQCHPSSSSSGDVSSAPRTKPANRPARVPTDDAQTTTSGTSA